MLTDVSAVLTASIIRAIHRTTETSVNFNVTTRSYIPKDSKRHKLFSNFLLHNIYIKRKAGLLILPGSLFYSAFSVTRLNSVDGRVTSE
jgi:hypothetical protein